MGAGTVVLVAGRVVVVAGWDDAGPAAAGVVVAGTDVVDELPAGVVDVVEVDAGAGEDVSLFDGDLVSGPACAASGSSDGPSLPDETTTTTSTAARAATTPTTASSRRPRNQLTASC